MAGKRCLDQLGGRLWCHSDKVATECVGATHTWRRDPSRLAHLIALSQGHGWEMARRNCYRELLSEQLLGERPWILTR